MVTFTISDDNNITAHANADEARSEAGAGSFDSANALAEVSTEWPASRLVEIWNSIPGNTPVKRFENRKRAWHSWAGRGLGPNERCDSACQPALKTAKNN